MNVDKRKLWTAASVLILSGPLTAQQQPNIILFLVDDMGWQDTSVPFWTETTELNQIYHTPNMERLAQMGVKFTHAYANSISSPSRVSLFTGANAARHRVTNWTLKKDVSTTGRTICWHSVIGIIRLVPAGRYTLHFLS